MIKDVNVSASGIANQIPRTFRIKGKPNIQDGFMNIATICSSNRMVPIKNSPPQVTAVNKAR